VTEKEKELFSAETKDSMTTRHIEQKAMLRTLTTTHIKQKLVEEPAPSPQAPNSGPGPDQASAEKK
jgi:hypothetical protein